MTDKIESASCVRSSRGCRNREVGDIVLSRADDLDRHHDLPGRIRSCPSWSCLQAKLNASPLCTQTM